MLKKCFVIVLILIFSTACSRNVKDKRIFSEKSELYHSYINWELDELSEKIDRKKEVYGDTPEIRTYFSLLEERIIAKKEFEDTIKKIKNGFSENNLTPLKDHIAKGLKREVMMRNLKSIDFSTFKIFVSKANFKGETAVNTIAFNVKEEFFYFDAEYNYTGEEWKIVKFQERR